MTTQHTLGPWTPFKNCIAIGVTAADADIAHCSGFQTSRSTEEVEANARLIAAAPELLAELKAKADALDRVAAATKNNGVLRELLKGYAEDMRTAAAKAESGQ